MRERDPLEEWGIFLKMVEFDAKDLASRQAQAAQSLEQLAAYLASAPGDKKHRLERVNLNRWNGAPLPPELLRRAEGLYPALVERGGSGSSYTQEGLLTLIAISLSEDSLPFWESVLALNRPRDTFANRRRQFALAALALLASARNSAVAEQALRNATRQPNEKVRGLAVRYLGGRYLETEQPLPEDLVALFSELAIYDKAFEPRFMACDMLRAADLQVPLDNPGGVYAFKVRFKYDKSMYRVIELRSEQTLEDLHLAIQQAIAWDNDHLYSFFLNNEKYDDRFEFASGFNQDAPRWTDDGVLGELGLVEKHKFLYFFDYGDSHQFEVAVVRISPQAGKGKYPRVTEQKGKSPKQYQWGDDEDEFDENDEDDEDDE